MKTDRKQTRRWLVVIFTLIVAGLAVGLPFVLDFREQELELETTGVVASTRDTHIVTGVTDLVPLAGARLVSGTLTIVSPDKQKLSGTRAMGLLKGGLADLALNQAEVRVGEPLTLLETRGGSTEPGQEAPIIAALTQGRFSNLRLSNSTFVIVLPNGSEERLEKVKAVFARVGRTAIRGHGRGKWRGQRIQFNLKSDGRRSQVKDGGIPFEFDMSGRLVSISLKGTMSARGGLRFDGHAELRTSDLRRLALSLGAHWPGRLGGRALAVRGPFSWTGDVAAFSKATVAIDANEGGGAISLNTGGTKPLITGTLAFDDFNMAAYLGLRQPGGSDLTRFLDGSYLREWLQRLGAVWTLPLAHQVDADFRLSAKKIQWDASKIGPAAMTVALKNGKLSAHLAEVLFDGGAGSGQIAIDFNGLVPQWTLRGRLKSAPAGQLSEALFGKQYLVGSATLAADLLAQGHSGREILDTLSGSIEAEMAAGGLLKLNLHALEGVPLAAKSSSAAAGNGDTALAGFVAIGNGTTKIDQLQATILLHNGRAEVTAAKAFYADGSRVAKLKGRLEPTAGKLAFTAILRPQPEAVRPNAKPASAVQTGKRGDAAVKGRVFTWLGGWDSPEITVHEHSGSADSFDKLLRLPKAKSERPWGMSPG